MRAIKTCLMVAVILLIGAAAGAEDKKTIPPVTWSTTMPAIELSNQPLEKVLNELKEKLPGFNFSISRENVPHDYPVLPAMTVENISLSQFVQLVQSEIPGVQIQTNEFGGGQTIFNGELQPTAVTCNIIVTPNPNIPAPPQPIVRIFGLSDAIACPAILRGNAEVEKRATDDILSLIQAALEVDGETPAPLLKVHAATHTLIFKGSPSQADIIANVIAVSQASAKLRSYDTDSSTPSAAPKLSLPTTQPQK